MNSIFSKDFPKKYRTSNFALFLRFPAFQTFSSRSFPSSSSSHWMWWSTHGSSSFHPSSILWFLSMLSEFLEQFLPRIPSLMKHYNRSQSHDLKFMCSSDKNQHLLRKFFSGTAARWLQQQREGKGDRCSSPAYSSPLSSSTPSVIGGQ